MNRAFARSDRIGQVERLLLTSRVPLSQAEIARRCAVHRATIGRLVQSMIDHGIPVRYTDDGRVYVERTAYISKIHLNLHEALALYLAGRLLSRYSDKPNSHMVAALSKIGVALHAVMPALGEHITTTSAALQQQLPVAPSAHQRVLERLTEAWARGVKVRVWYQPLRASTPFQHTFAPYFIEPSAIGYSTYAIGLAEPPGQIRTRKLERITRIELTEEPYTIPDEFDPNALLARAWGIWFERNDQPTHVQVRFRGAQAVRRVQETIWHPSQQLDIVSSDELVWSAMIDEPQEMLPWLRGWGADCEVLSPPTLRAQIADELLVQMQHYGLSGAAAEPELVAHTPAPGSSHWHGLVDHLTAVANLARQFAEPFGGGEIAYLLGLWHDIGKSNPAFQDYLRRAHRDPTARGRGPDHKAAGAVIATHINGMLALIIQGHHGGLQSRSDCLTWMKQREADTEPDGQTPAAQAAIARMASLLPAIHPTHAVTLPGYIQDKLSFEFFLRMLFSALVDADFLDTEAHFSQDTTALRTAQPPMDELLSRFDADQQRLTAHAADTPVNRARAALYTYCVQAATRRPGLFRLAIPTGGGKTRAGMAFALRHAVEHGIQRVIVAVPYISITEQTAEVYRGIFDMPEQQVVLEHHSGVAGRTEADDYQHDQRWQRLASENWDAPIIVTTTVQLFESLFAHQTGRCRKLHRLANSVIILDEAQALPVQLLTPMLDALRQLCAHYGTTVVLSTATQPAFEEIPAFAQLSASDIIPADERWWDTLRRVTYTLAPEPLSWQDVAARMQASSHAMTIVNTRKDALALFAALGDDPDALHLSTLLCGAHRRAVIAEVTARLRDGRPCRLVTTQIVEAGVDLDFPLVLRAFGPYERIIQAAGRCNREGRMATLGEVLIFTPADASALPPGAYKIATNTTRAFLDQTPINFDDPAVTRQYFTRWYQAFAEKGFDVPKIQEQRKGFLYKEVSEHFRMIDDDTEDVIITTYGTDKQHELVRGWLQTIERSPASARAMLRKLQPYTVAIRTYLVRQYRDTGFIETVPIGDGDQSINIWRATYDPRCGIIPDDDRSLLSQ